PGQGRVHSDLRPASVMLAPGSAGLSIPKVADFGLAKALAVEEELAHATRSGVTMGTPAYMAPEQIRDAKKVDHRADVFSLGCILYELVCGRPPFVGPDVLSIFNAVASGSFPAPDSLVPELPARFRAAIHGALSVDRERRLQDCGALLAALDGSRPPMPAPALPSAGSPTFDPASLDVPARPSPPRRGLARFRRRPRRLGRRGARWWFAAALGVTLGLGTVVSASALTLVALAASAWEKGLRADIASRTQGELTWSGARLRPRGLVLTGVTLRGADGAPVLEVP